MVEYLLWENAQLKERIGELERQLGKDSHNSSKPPSSDGLKKVPKSQRKQSGRKAGGQRGHKGYRLEPVQKPDREERHKVEECEHCGISLSDVSTDHLERRQVFDIPMITIVVTEHQAEVKICPCCGGETMGRFPSGVTGEVQYGNQLKSLCVYLQQYQLLPYERATEVIEDLVGQRISVGTLYNMNQSCYEGLASVESSIRMSIQAAPVVHFDESGMRSEKKTKWLHVASTEDLTLYQLHEKRGEIAMNAMGVLPDYKGRAVHDHWKPYFKYGCDHSLCNAHHLRELTFIAEEEKEAWAETMKKCLLEMKKVVYEAKALGNISLYSEEEVLFEKRYRAVIKEGYDFHQGKALLLPPISGKRGRKKQPPGKNLLDRLDAYQEETLVFMKDFRVPFDNNLGERDIRMAKLRQKISGCFRNDTAAAFFCRIRGYISTARKNGLGALEAIQLAFAETPFTPPQTAS